MRPLLVLLCFPLVAFAEDPPHIAAAKRRQQDRIELKATAFIFKKPTTIEYSLDAPKSRLVETDATVPSEAIAVYDGEVTKSQKIESGVRLYSAMNHSKNIPPQKKNEFHIIGDRPISRLPGISWIYRSLETSLLKYADWKPTGETELVDGVECAVYFAPYHEDAILPVKSWLDPKRDYLPMRIVIGSTGGICDDVVFNYGADSHLTGWTLTMTRGITVVIETVVVDSLKFGGPIPPERFELKFPPGTEIYDHSRPGVKARQKIVGPDGSLRELSFRVMPGVPDGWPQYAFATVFSIAILAFVFGTCWMTAYIVAAIWKRIRRRRKNRTPANAGAG